MTYAMTKRHELCGLLNHYREGKHCCLEPLSPNVAIVDR